MTDEEELQMLTEFMCAAPSGFRNVKSTLTLALMEDSGWYQVFRGEGDAPSRKTPPPPQGGRRRRLGRWR